MASIVRMDTEDLSKLTTDDLELTRKGQLAVDYGDPRLTRQQITLLTVIAYLKDRNARMTAEPTYYTLAPTYKLAGKGICPVCGYDWASDPNNYCHCTAPHPDDDEQRAKAFAVSARQRTVKIQADLAEALAADEARIRELGRSFKARPPKGAVVVPIGRGQRRRKPGRRKRSS